MEDPSSGSFLRNTQVLKVRLLSMRTSYCSYPMTLASLRDIGAFGLQLTV